MSAEQLRDEIRRFQRRKKWFALPLVLLGLIMLVTPGPGMAILLLGFMLLFPRDGHRVLNWIRARWRRLRGSSSTPRP
ncbi:MAG: hypothetical protein BWY77_00998 [bacterium ADurb.Bin431]|jgi:hypothetical protein|nr:MAG: hypothetical protein BWY77_00998 [bacterium ADurb.Bin431]HNY91540.1 hypothetical protein [bacterium]HOC24851.1 hypothetical protein [bacterium]HOH08914.1 hypothetical protein [bacterium]HOY45659.1 hypothetical protein [bacterium]